MKQRKLSDGQSRAALIASYSYGTDKLTQWGEPVESYADVSKEERKNAHTMEDGSYPISKCTGEGPSVESAIHAVGRGSGDHDAIRRHIMDAASKEGCSNLIPDNWNSDGSIDESKSSMAAEDGKPPAAKPPTEDKPEGPDLDADVDVTKAIDAAIAAQKADPDKGDPNDEKVLKLLEEAKTAQAADTEDTAKKSSEPAKPPPPKAPPVTAAAEPPPNPVDEQGNVDDDHDCTRPECGHPASAHANTPDGENTGACSMCDCPQMKVASHESDEDEPETPESEGGEPEAEQEQKLGGVVVDGGPGAVPGAAPVDGATDTNLNPPPEVDGGENLGPQFSGVLVIEGQPTGDGRQIQPEALTWREPPLPLMLLKTETHDPEGFDMNDPAVICGRIDTLTREPGDGDTQLVTFGGHFLANEDGAYAADLTEAMGRLGVSADIAVQASEVTITDVDEMGFPMDMSEVLTEGTVMGGTACPFPAFQGCYIVLGDGSEPAEAKTPQESPLMSEPPEAVTAGGQLIHWLSYEECGACDQGFEVITASGAGPVRPPMAWFADPNFTEGDGRLAEILDRRGQRSDKYACPVTVTTEGRVFGHIAAWDICHTGKPGQCVVAPRSAVNYAHFKQGSITTAEGEQIRVGAITADTTHAPLSFSPTAALRHYEDTSLVVADVVAGEDEYGIWIAGAIRPDATEEQIRNLTAASLSGDWREIGGQLELVAALAVPMPGFPLAMVAHGRQESLVAATSTVMHKLKYPPAPEPEGDVALRRAVGPLLRQARENAREKVAGLTVS